MPTSLFNNTKLYSIMWTITSTLSKSLLGHFNEPILCCNSIEYVDYVQFFVWNYRYLNLSSFLI